MPPSALRGVAAILVSGGAAGVLIGGLGSRVAMRIAALTARDGAQGVTTEAGATIGRITLEGTLFLVLFAGIGAALVGSAFYLATLPWLPHRRPLRALAFGGLELVVFGTTLLDAGNPDFTILGSPLLDVLLLGSLFVVHGVVLVLLVQPCERLISWAAGDTRWRGRIVDIATLFGMALTTLGVAALVARAGGWARVVTIAMLVCATGLTLLDPRRTRPVTRPALRVVGAFALTFLAVSGILALMDQVAAIA